MRVLLIHQAFVSPEEAGGTRHFELGSRLVSEGDHFTIVASDRSYLTGTLHGKSDETISGLRILRAYTLPTVHRSFVWRVVAFLSFMVSSVFAALRTGRVDVVMGTTPPIFQAVSAWLVAFLRRKPFLLEVRDLWPEFAIDMGVLTNPILIGLSRWLEGFLYNRATHLMVNSPAYRDYLIKKGIAPERISFISNGVDAALFDPAQKGSDFREQYKLDGKFVITYAGAMGMANDLGILLEAANLSKDQANIVFLIVGDGKERPALEKRSRELGLTNVIFTGSVKKNRMPEVLAASDACVAILKNIPMFNTTYPNKVFDYMAAGRPTLLAIDGVIRKVIEDAAGGIFIPPGDAAALAAAAVQLALDPAIARAMGVRARDFVLKHFDRNVQGAEFAALLHSLTKAGS